MKSYMDNLQFKEISEGALLIQRIRSDIFCWTHSFFRMEDFMLIDPPTLHEHVKNKKHEIYLSINNNSYSLSSSNALYMGAYSSLFGNVYTISTCFRNEQESVNHLLEFKMLEVEMQNSKFDDLLDFVEKYIKFLLTRISEKYSGTGIGKRANELIATFNPLRISYNDFMCEINLQQKNKFDFGVDLSTIDYIVSRFIRKPVFIVDYPFRMATWTAKPKLKNIAYAFNLILPDGFGELAEGCERNNDVSRLKYKFCCANIENLQWYLDAIEKSVTNRSGFGIGLDRLVRWIVNADDIKKTVLFSR